MAEEPAPAPGGVGQHQVAAANPDLALPPPGLEPAAPHAVLLEELGKVRMELAALKHHNVVLEEQLAALNDHNALLRSTPVLEEVGEELKRLSLMLHMLLL